MKYTFTPEELEEILRKCWESSKDYNKQINRLNLGCYNFNEPVKPDFDKFHETIMKELKGY